VRAPPRYGGMMNALMLTMIGGALGAGGRYLTGLAALRTLGSGYPWGTLIVNVAGGLLMGILAVRVAADDPWRILLGMGVLGGFTTFSAFSLETLAMLQRGAAGTALAYALISVIAAVGAVWTGMELAR
jgi:fluoride exporter